MHRFAALALLLALPISCASQADETSAPAPSNTAPTEEGPIANEPAPIVGTCPVEGEVPERFGKALDAAGRELTSLAAVVANPDAHVKQQLLVSGVVRASCTKKGCWMEIRPEEDRAADALTVRFEDYGFFVPLNSRGATVKLDGRLAVVTFSAEEVAHLEAEGATFAKKNPDGSVRQVEFTALGVEMCGRKR